MTFSCPIHLRVLSLLDIGQLKSSERKPFIDFSSGKVNFDYTHVEGNGYSPSESYILLLIFGLVYLISSTDALQIKDYVIKMIIKHF